MRADATPPKPLKIATSCGMAVMGTRWAQTTPMTAPDRRRHGDSGPVQALGVDNRRDNGRRGARHAQPVARAGGGRRTPSLDAQRKRRRGDDTTLQPPQSAADHLARRSAGLNISSMRSMTAKPPTAMMVASTWPEPQPLHRRRSSPEIVRLRWRHQHDNAPEMALVPDISGMCNIGVLW